MHRQVERTQKKCCARLPRDRILFPGFFLRHTQLSEHPRASPRNPPPPAMKFVYGGLETGGWEELGEVGVEHNMRALECGPELVDSLNLPNLLHINGLVGTDTHVHDVCKGSDTCAGSPSSWASLEREAVVKIWMAKMSEDFTEELCMAVALVAQGQVRFGHVWTPAMRNQKATRKSDW